MGKVTFDISVSLDGYLAGPNPRLEEPLGDGGEQLHEWGFRLAAWRRPHGLEGGETGPDSEVVEETLGSAGAFVMGRNMFGGGEGPWGAAGAPVSSPGVAGSAGDASSGWGDDPWQGWWGDDPPFHAPVYVLTHHPREPLVKQGGTTFHFVTEGIEAAVEQARAAAGDRDVQIAGGADVVRQSLNGGLVDRFQLHVVPVVLGGGVRLLDGLEPGRVRVELDRVVDSPTVTHLRYRVVR